MYRIVIEKGFKKKFFALYLRFFAQCVLVFN